MSDDRKTLSVRLSKDELKDYKIALLEIDQSNQDYLYNCIIELINKSKKRDKQKTL